MNTSSAAERLPDRRVEQVMVQARMRQYWPRVLPMLAPALQDGTMAEVYVNLISGRAQLWIGWLGDEIEFSIVTEIRHYPDKQLAYVCLAGGEMGPWMEYLPMIEQWARDVGCDVVRVHGRPGWKRILPEYQHKASILEKAL